MTVTLQGIGLSHPAFAFTADMVEEFVRHTHSDDPRLEKLLPVLYRRSGVQQRYLTVIDSEEGSFADRVGFYPDVRTCDDGGPTTQERMKRYSEAAIPLACESARNAFADCDINASDVTHLVTVSCTGFFAPGVDIALIRDLGLSSTTQRTHVGFMGCHGAFNGLRVAKALIEADPSAVVLLNATELSSLHHQYCDDPEQAVASSLFADGSASLVLGSAAAGPDQWSVRASGSCVVPGSEELMSWKIGDHGFRMTLSSELPKLIGEHLPSAMEDWLAQHDLTVEEIGSWAVHPGGPRILDAVQEALGLTVDDLEPSRQILRNFGNMSSPTVLFLIHRFIARQAARPCVTLGFGPGITIEMTLWT